MSHASLQATQQRPIRIVRFAGLVCVVVGSLLQSVLENNAVVDAINLDLHDGRLPLDSKLSGGTPAGVAANVATATKALYKLPAQCGGTVSGAAYEARVLTGIWAVAPYLHNGSVASLAELLKPPGARLSTFAVGHQDFDPVNVGLVTDKGPAWKQMFVVNAANGNGNGGHDYGTALSQADKSALIEYLKTLGSANTATAAR